MQDSSGTSDPGDHTRSLGVTHCATPPRCRRWPGRCGSNKRRHPRGGRRAHADRLRHAPDSGAGHPCRRPLRGDQLRLAVASRLVLRRQADHPVLRRFADRRRAGDRQQLPIRQAGRSAPSDFTRGFAGGVSDARTAWQLHTLRRGPEFRSSSPSTTTSTATRTTLRCNGFAESTRYLACSEPASTGESMPASGPPPMVLSGIRARLAAGGPGRPGPGRTVRSNLPQFSTSAS